ncbi:activator of basal transcription 1-like [Ptychodera flava]|uniref:activator of basal transcription 1-like n=1 Tax=Ptychodera flava TaxID=63121 RepID=UPI00396A14A4
MAATTKKRVRARDESLVSEKRRKAKKVKGEENIPNIEDDRFTALKFDKRFSLDQEDHDDDNSDDNIEDNESDVDNDYDDSDDDKDDTNCDDDDDDDEDDDDDDDDATKEEEDDENDDKIAGDTEAPNLDDEGESQEKKNLTPGIIYLSKIPPFMKPKRIRMIFSQYGELGRLFLQPETKFKQKERKKRGGNSSKSFEEGWVEFQDKKIAKQVAWTLNNTPIGGKKRSRYYHDIWNIKYLSRFKWTHLSEKLAYERAVREQRMRTEISQARKETSFYLQSVQKKRMVDEITERKRKKGQEVKNFEKKFKQRDIQTTELKEKPTDSKKGKGIKSDLLLKIFKGGS